MNKESTSAANGANTSPESEGVKFFGTSVLSVGVRAITRKGNLKTEECGYGVALLLEKENGKRQYRTLADLLKGCKDIAGAAYEEYTREAFSEVRAHILADKFAKACGIPLQAEEAKRLAEFAEMAKKAKAGKEAKKTEEGEAKEEKAKKAKKTTAQKLVDIVNCIGGTVEARATPLIDALEKLHPLAAQVARLAISGATPEEVAIKLEEARLKMAAAHKEAAKK